MGYINDIRIVIAKKGYELFLETAKKQTKGYSQELVDNFHVFDDRDKEVLLGWNGIKWGKQYHGAEAVILGLKKLDEVVEEDPEILEEYYYKIIIIGEDGLTSVDTNDYDDEYTEDYYKENDFSEACYPRTEEIKDTPLLTTDKMERIAQKVLEIAGNLNINGSEGEYNVAFSKVVETIDMIVNKR